MSHWTPRSVSLTDDPQDTFPGPPLQIAGPPLLTDVEVPSLPVSLEDLDRFQKAYKHPYPTYRQVVSLFGYLGYFLHPPQHPLLSFTTSNTRFHVFLYLSIPVCEIGRGRPTGDVSDAAAGISPVSSRASGFCIVVTGRTGE